MNIMNLALRGVDEKGNEKTYKLSDFYGKTIALYFYSKDNTAGCAQEAGDFRDHMPEISSKATVIGVSPDSVPSHKRFQDEKNLNFILLSDPDHQLAEAFEAWGKKKIAGSEYKGMIRSTFILNPNGKIIKNWKNVRVNGHVDEVVRHLI